MSTEREPLHCRLESLPGGTVCEFIAYSQGGTMLRAAGWPCLPGEVRRGDDATPLLLHFAPGRWLAPTSHHLALAAVHAAVEAGAGDCVAVEGKWHAMQLSGAHAARALASTVDITAMLDGRECAATTLFDCPAIVMRMPDGFALWLLASYAEDFIAAIARLNGAVPTAIRES